MLHCDLGRPCFRLDDTLVINLARGQKFAGSQIASMAEEVHLLGDTSECYEASIPFIITRTGHHESDTGMSAQGALLGIQRALLVKNRPNS
jgi:hypothetical protein